MIDKKVDGASIGEINIHGGVKERGWSKNDIDLMVECHMTPEAEDDIEGGVFERDWYRCQGAIEEFMKTELKCKPRQGGDEGGIIVSTPFDCPLDEDMEWIIDIFYEAIWPSEKYP